MPLFNNSSKTDDAIYDYILIPEKYIKEKYLEKSEKFNESVISKLNEYTMFTLFFDELKACCLIDILQILEITIKYAEEGFSKNIIEIRSKEEIKGILQIEVEEKFKNNIFNCLIDLLLGRKPKYQYRINPNTIIEFFVKKDIEKALKGAKKIKISFLKRY